MKTVLFLILLVLALAACAGGEGDPAETVETYLQAKVDGDRETIQANLCSEMEVLLEGESRTFESVSGVELDGMACQRVGDGDGVESDVVSCDGRIVALYGAEETEFPLISYRVVLEDGQWKWCGEAAAP